MLSFDAQKFLILKSNLSIFFCCCVFGVRSKKSLPNSMSWRFSRFLLRLFIVFALKFRSLIHFGLIFVYGMRKGSHSFACGYPVFPPPPDERLSFFHCMVLTPFKKFNWPWTSLVAQWLSICLPMQGTRVWALVREDPTCRGATKPMCHNYWDCDLEPASHNYWAHVPQLLKPTRLEPMLHNKRSHLNEKPAHRNKE